MPRRQAFPGRVESTRPDGPRLIHPDHTAPQHETKGGSQIAIAPQKPKLRVQAWIRQNLDLPTELLANEAVEAFHDQEDVVAWAISVAIKWERSAFASRKRKEQTKQIWKADSAPRMLELLTQFEETNGFHYQSIKYMTKPEGLAYCEKRENEIRGQFLHVNLIRDIFEALPDDQITPAEFFRDDEERTLEQIIQQHKTNEEGLIT